MNFTAILTVDGNHYQLLFKKTELSQKPSYFIIVKSSFKESFSFEIARERGRWKVLRPVPAWVLECETQLIDIIKMETEKSFS